MYHHVFVGGTFDGLHKGHRMLLTRAFTEGQIVTVGLTTDEFIKKFKTPASPAGRQKSKLKTEIQNSKLSSRLLVLHSYMMRKNTLTQWLHDKKFLDRSDIIPIDDPHEPAASIDVLDALLVTRETRARGEKINSIRAKRGLVSLALIEVPMVSAHDGDPISATRVRKGEIDREGRLVMPESLRSLLAKPLGTVHTGQSISLSLQRNKGKTIITVGDVATKTLLDHAMTPTLAIIDFRVGRKPYYELETYVHTLVLHSTRVKSGPGYISGEATQAIQAILARRATQVTRARQVPVKNQLYKERCSIIVVDGEEDLLVLPVILYAPLGSIVYYGQPRVSRDKPRIASVRSKPHGLVEVVVTEEKKQEAQAFLNRFT